MQTASTVICPLSSAFCFLSSVLCPLSTGCLNLFYGELGVGVDAHVGGDFH